MRRKICTLLGMVALLGLLTVARAADKKDKEVTLKGTICCSKCALKVTADCGTAIVVKEGGKDVSYLVKDNGKAESYHGKFCTKGKAGAKGSVTGVVSEEDGKKYITPAKDGVKFN